MQHQHLIVRWAMPITIVLLFVLSIFPVRWLGWTDWFAAQVRVAIVPITHPLTIAIDAIVPTRISNPEASARERMIGSELERVRLELLQTRQENARLSQLIEQYSRGAAITPELNVKQVTRPRVGNLSGDLLLIRNGTAEVVQGTVVVADAVQLIGRVSRVDGKTSIVLPITAPGAQPLMGTVLLSDDGQQQARCFLKPTGDGTLRGEVAHPSTSGTLSIQVGQEVRLQDSQWPTSAQMLLIGLIERVENNPDQPLRPRIIVRPQIEDLRRIPEVIFRIPITDDSGDGGHP